MPRALNQIYDNKYKQYIYHVALVNCVGLFNHMYKQ